MLTPLSLSASFGFGDRLGLATPGHLAALRAASQRGIVFAPILAQQSVRENARTGRTPQNVIDDARRAAEAAGWDGPWGADADHLKNPDDIAPFAQAGYTFYTVDPGDHVDNNADSAPLDALRTKLAGAVWEDLASRYLNQGGEPAWGRFSEETLLRAAAKYGRAIEHAAAMYRRLADMVADFDFEVSVDETDSPTTALEHYFIVNELVRLGVHFTSLAPRFIGRFEKGVDYIGDLTALDAELARHAAVTAHFGTYKLSLHSGSDKFSVYPLIARHWGSRLHVKTAGTSYLEALRVLARLETGLFQKIYALGCARYETDRRSYHVSASLDNLPHGGELPDLLDDFHAREILHVTYGSALAQFGAEIRAAMVKHGAAYQEGLQNHFEKHLNLLKQPA